MALSFSSQYDADQATLNVSGDIDISTAEALEQAIAATIDHGAGHVIVDLSGVRFMDSAGINALLKGRRWADDHGQQFRVTGATGIVRQVLDLTGVAVHLSGPAG
jgi:anti-sigma B factor antagonist